MDGNPTQTGTNFCRYIIKELFDLPDDEADVASVGGGDDGGIDAGFARFGTFTIVQAKYSHKEHWSQIVRLTQDARRFQERELNADEKRRLAPLLESQEAATEEGPLSYRLFYITADNISDKVYTKVRELSCENLTVLDLERISSYLQWHGTHYEA
ncbi:MAG: hypothetical protein DLM53_05765, partial [Candidatus Eremiobacter antarcticus]